MKDVSCGFMMQVTIHLRDIEEGADEFNKAWGEVMDPEHLPVILLASSLAHGPRASAGDPPSLLARSPSHWCAAAGRNLGCTQQCTELGYSWNLDVLICILLCMQARTTVQAHLMRPDLLVEATVIAAVKPAQD